MDDLFYCWHETKQKINLILTLWPLFVDRVQLPQATEALRGDSLLFTIKFPEIPGTRLISFGRMKGRVDLGAAQLF